MTTITSTPSERTQIGKYAIGALLIITGLILNKWTLSKVFSPDGEINSLLITSIVTFFDLILIGTGIWLAGTKQGKSFYNRYFQELILFLVTLILLVVFAEVGIRVYLGYFAQRETIIKYGATKDIPPEWWIFSDQDPYLPFVPTANYRKGNQYHNSRGFRGKELVIPKPANHYRIAVIGGSTVYETAVKDNDSIFTTQLEDNLSRKYPELKVEVINGGSAAYTSWESLVTLAFRVLDYEPDMVILSDGLFDANCRFIEHDTYQGNNSGYRSKWKMPDYGWTETLGIIRIIRRHLGASRQLDLTQAVGLRIPDSQNPKSPARYAYFDSLLTVNPPIYFERNIRNMVAIAQAQSIKPVLVAYAWTPNFLPRKGIVDYASLPYYQKAFEEHNALLQKIAVEKGIPFYDHVAEMPKDTSYWADGRHVNAKGSIVKAEMFTKFLLDNNLIPHSKCSLTINQPE